MTRPTRVLLVADSIEPHAGTENQILELARRIDTQRIRLWVVCLEDGPRLQSIAPTAIPLALPMKAIFSLHGLRQILRLRQHIRELEIDVVQGFMVRSSILAVLAAQGVAGSILTSRRNLGSWYTPSLLRTFRILNRMSTRILANSEGAKQSAIELEKIAPERVDVLYNGVDLDRFAPRKQKNSALLQEWGIPESSLVVGIVANYRPIKNLPLFLKAAQRVALEYPEVRFVLVGQGPLREELVGLAQELGIRSRVVFTDDRGDLPSLLALMDIASLTSNSEGFSNAILEYMAAGKAVVATAVGGIPEAVKEGETGFLVPPGDVDGLSHALKKLLGDDDLRLSMGVQGRARCEALFGLKLSIRRQEAYWERLCAF